MKELSTREGGLLAHRAEQWLRSEAGQNGPQPEPLALHLPAFCFIPAGVWSRCLYCACQTPVVNHGAEKHTLDSQLVQPPHFPWAGTEAREKKRLVPWPKLDALLSPRAY